MTRPLARLADRWRNVPLVAGMIALTLLVAGLGVIFNSAADYDRQKRQETVVQARILAANVTAALDFGDARTAQESVDALALNPQVSAAGVYDAAGRLFAGYTRTPGLLAARAGAEGHHGGNVVEANAPVARGGARIGSVYLQVVREPTARRVARYSVIGFLIILASLVVLVLGIAQTALRRANRELAERAGALGEANSQLEVQMEERAKAEEQLRQAQKMQALGQLTGGIAHDFNNLLTVIQGSADMLRRPAIEEAKRIRYANAIVQTAGRAAALTSQLLAFARRQPLKPQRVDLNHRITAMTDLLDRALGERILVRTDFADASCPVEVDPAQLESAVLNIAVNARDAMPDGGTLTIATGRTQLADGRNAACLSIADTGGGIPADMLEHVFEPFFTTKAVGKGTGLGLSQVYGFAAQSGGEVRVASEVGRGTVVTIVLPCSDVEEALGATEAKQARAPARTGRILLVDDNEDVGQLAESLLTELGHSVVRATSGPEALLAAAREQFDAVLTDVVMPGMGGIELADRLATVLPAVPVVLSTGYSDQLARSGTGGRPILFKPYRMDALADALNKVLAVSSDAR